MEARCEECGEPAVEVEPTTWNSCWGRKPQWSHEDGEPLCSVLGADGYGPCGVIFV